MITVGTSSRLLEGEEEQVLSDGGRVLHGDSAVKAISSSEIDAAAEENQNEDAKYMLLEEDSTVINLQIKATPESAVYPAPTALALLLNGDDRKAMLNSLLSNYDTTYTITSTEFTRYLPAFPVTPICSDISWDWAQIQGTLNNYGFIFVTMLKASEDVGKPSPYQIARGFNNKNIQNPAGSFEISTPYKDFNVNVTGLDPLTDYNVYVVAGSAHPGYPDLIKAESIKIITIKTLPAPVSKYFFKIRLLMFSSTTLEY